MPSRMRSSVVVIRVRHFSRTFIGRVDPRLPQRRRKSHRGLSRGYLAGGSGMLQSHEEKNQINDEQQDNRSLQHQHPAVGLVVLEQLVEVVEGFEFDVDGPVPVAQMEPGGNVFINASKVPVTKTFGDVQKLITQ